MDCAVAAKDAAAGERCGRQIVPGPAASNLVVRIGPARIAAEPGFDVAHLRAALWT